VLSRTFIVIIVKLGIDINQTKIYTADKLDLRLAMMSINECPKDIGGTIKITTVKF